MQSNGGNGMAEVESCNPVDEKLLRIVAKKKVIVIRISPSSRHSTNRCIQQNLYSTNRCFTIFLSFLLVLDVANCRIRHENIRYDGQNHFSFFLQENQKLIEYAFYKLACKKRSASFRLFAGALFTNAERNMG
jgi:hypothetical protein